jgi:hypothetical protein
VSKTYQILDMRYTNPRESAPGFPARGYYLGSLRNPDGLYRTEMYYIFRAIDLWASTFSTTISGPPSSCAMS